MFNSTCEALQVSRSRGILLPDGVKVHKDEMTLEIAPDSAQVLADIIRNAGTVIWDGPGGRVRVRALFEGDQGGGRGGGRDRWIYASWRWG